MDPHYVAFIDILGFSQMVESDCRNPSQKFEHLQKLKQIFKDLIPTAHSEVKFVQFSDSIVLSAIYDAKELTNFLDICRELQSALFLQGILCRGGIALGQHYMEDNFLFSEGLISAYQIESQTARVPRIVVSKDLIELVQYTHPDTKFHYLLTENDGETFVDYVGTLPAPKVQELLLKLQRANASASTSVKDKINWLWDYCEHLNKLTTTAKRDRFWPALDGAK